MYSVYNDRFGRKTTLTLGVLTYFSLVIASCWLPTLGAVLTFRFLLGFLHPTIMQTGYILGEPVTHLLIVTRFTHSFVGNFCSWKSSFIGTRFSFVNIFLP